MPNKSKHHGHYCKVCGCRKSNESFSGNRHNAHICKACSKLPAKERAQRIRDNHMPSFRDMLHQEQQERNRIKSQLVIKHLIFSIHTDVYDEFGDSRFVNRSFEIERKTGLLTLIENDVAHRKQMRNAAKSLRWPVHTLEVFEWAERDSSIIAAIDEISDALHEASTEGNEEPIGSFDEVGDEETEQISDCDSEMLTVADELKREYDSYIDGITGQDANEREPAWSMHIRYSSDKVQSFVGYGELSYPALEFYEHLMEYFDDIEYEETDEMEDYPNEL